MGDASQKQYNVTILGGGITGAALLWVLSKYTNINSLALVEKYLSFGKVNTSSNSNSQTLHFGDIETNYTLEKAKKVKRGAEMTVSYLKKIIGDNNKIFRKSHKMALAVGKHEVEDLEKRFLEFKTLFPKLKKLNREEIAKIEPEVVRGRNPKEPILAIYSEDGYVVDFGKLSESFVKNAKKENQNIDIFLNRKVDNIIKEKNGFKVSAGGITLNSDIVIVAMGAYSLLFAKTLGYGGEYLLLPIVGNFYRSTCKILNGKVYTMQEKKLPFAAVHGDPDIHNPAETRFGPTAKALPILERRNIATFFDFIASAGCFDWAAVKSLLYILSDGVVFKFILRNFIYDLPIIGKWYFLRATRKIVPTITSRTCVFDKSLGGIRPQLVHKKKKKVMFGVGEIVGSNIIFNITPSPGATASIQNAEGTTKKIITFFGGKFGFNENKFKNDFGNN